MDSLSGYTARWQYFQVGILLLLFTGCGERTMTGGTAGSVTIDGQQLPDIQVSLFQNDGTKLTPIGFGVTDSEGKFLLLQNGAVGKLYLKPGEYRVTVETIGPEVAIPPDYLDPEKTPLQFTWSEEQKEMSLVVKTQKPEGE